MDAKNAYERAAADIKADKIIPSGEYFLKMSALGIKMYRDGSHATLGVGRYGLGLLWYSSITGKSVWRNSFSKFDEQISATGIEIAKRCADDLSDY